MMTWNGASMEMIESMKVVCDAGPIIHLDELNCLDLLTDFQEIILPDTVWKEIKKHRPSGIARPELSFTRLTGELPANELLITMCRAFSLDAGETEALALMEKNPKAIFLTDDASARLVAEQMGFRAHGTIGILIRSKRRGLRKNHEIIATLEKIPFKSTLYVKPSLLDEIILKVKKEWAAE